MELNDKVVVITGASSGIGKATAVAFAKKGAKIALAARRIDKLEDVRNHVFSYNKNCLCVQTDVSSEADVKRLFDTVEKKFGRIDILVNNAGRGLKSNICDTTFEDWISVLNTNLTGVFLCTREAVKRMLKKKSEGHIITVSSIAGLYGAPNYSAYCASKHGVTGLKRSLKFELFGKGIKTSMIFPARVDTDFFDIYKQRPSKSQMLSAEDIAEYIIAIASRNILMRVIIRIKLLFKRIYNFFRYMWK